MIKRFYSDYVRHALRFYSRNLENPVFKCQADEKNWIACDTILSQYFPSYKDALISVYQAFDTMGDNVYESAKRFNIPQANIWMMMESLEKHIAEERGLI